MVEPLWWLVVSEKRPEKQGAIVKALHAGMGPRVSRICKVAPPNPTDPFIGIGQIWGIEKLVPPALETGRPFFLIDNGYYRTSGRGNQARGHFEFTYRSLAPIVLADPDFSRFPASQCLKPWRPRREGYVLVGLPGPAFGKMIGLDMQAWGDSIVDRIRKHTDRPIRLREKTCTRPLSHDLDGASVVVTHSSNVAVDAIVEGVPCIVESLNPAAPVCSLDLADIEHPHMPDRTHWWASLMCQQFTMAEMASGLCWQWLQRIQAQVES
jgi:hypothetical protein